MRKISEKEKAVCEKIKELENKFMDIKAIITGDDIIEIKNSVFNTSIFMDWNKFLNTSLGEIKKVSHAGKNIEHITRVTGYFSRVNGWNKGKTEELKDRHRVSID